MKDHYYQIDHGSLESILTVATATHTIENLASGQRPKYLVITTPSTDAIYVLPRKDGTGSAQTDPAFAITSNSSPIVINVAGMVDVHLFNTGAGTEVIAFGYIAD